MKSFRIVSAMIAAFLILSALVPAGQKAVPKPPLKVFISVDMEGISGVVHGDQTLRETPEYRAAHKWMAQDVNAAVQGALEAGTSEIVVNDSHSSMRNIDPDDLNLQAALINGSPKPLSIMQGIDASLRPASSSATTPRPGP